MKHSAAKALSFFQFLSECGQIDKNVVITIASGEISIHPEREAILSAVKDYPVWVLTNASVYNDSIARLLRAGRSKILVSLDCGTRDTFTRVKGIDAFEKTCDNLKRYASHGHVELKYIVLPGMNDNDADIHGFAAICAELDIKYVDVASNLYETRPYSQRTINMIALLTSLLHQSGINISAPDWVFTGVGGIDRVHSALI